MVSGPRVLTRQHLKDRGVTFCNFYLLKLEREGRFPKRIRLGERTVAWYEHEVDHWIEARAAERLAA